MKPYEGSNRTRPVEFFRPPYDPNGGGTSYVVPTGMRPLRRDPCGCLHDHLGNALLVCAGHVRDVEGVEGCFRLRGTDGELRLVPVEPLPQRRAGS